MLIPAGKLMTSSAKIYKDKFKQLGHYVWIMLIPTLLIAVVDKKTGLVAIPGIFLNVFISLALSVLLIWISIALIRATASAINNKPIKKYSKELRDTSSLIIPMIFASILSGAAVLGGLILLIIPGIVFIIWFTFVSQEIALNGRSATRSLSTSKDLVEGRWWAVCWRVVAPGFIFLVIVAIIQMIVGLILLPLNLLGNIGTGTYYVITLLSTLIHTTISVFFIPCTLK